MPPPPATLAKVRGRLEDAQQHASEMELARERAAEEAEAAAREGMAAQSSRELCEQMGGVCRQMRQAAEDAGKRSAEAEESASFVVFLGGRFRCIFRFSIHLGPLTRRSPSDKLPGFAVPVVWKRGLETKPLELKSDYCCNGVLKKYQMRHAARDVGKRSPDAEQIGEFWRVCWWACFCSTSVGYPPLLFIKNVW